MKQAEVQDAAIWPSWWKSGLVFVDEIGEVLGYYGMKDKHAVYSEKQLLSDQRKDLLATCIRNKAQSYVLMYRCAVNAVDDVMCNAVQVRASIGVG
ncbi:MAG TPA: hypothetical protein V6C97_16115 [Oculatellaceae cyanobacterium]